MQRVSDWHVKTLESLGMKLIEDYHIPTRRNRFGLNADKRVEYEHIYTLIRKGCA